MRDARPAPANAGDGRNAKYKLFLQLAINIFYFSTKARQRRVVVEEQEAARSTPWE